MKEREREDLRDIRRLFLFGLCAQPIELGKPTSEVAVILVMTRKPHRGDTLHIEPDVNSGEENRGKKRHPKRKNTQKSIRNRNRNRNRKGMTLRAEQEKKTKHLWSDLLAETYFQIYLSMNKLVRLLRQLLRDHLTHCVRYFGLLSKVVCTSQLG